MGIHSRDEELKAQSRRFFIRIGLVCGLVAIVALAVAAVPGCASVCIVELGIPPTVDCKKIGER